MCQLKDDQLSVIGIHYIDVVHPLSLNLLPNHDIPNDKSHHLIKIITVHLYDQGTCSQLLCMSPISIA